MSSKPGRNDPCPCSSGKKFKKCHGSIEQPDRQQPELKEQLAEFARASRASHEAREFQRQEQQGLGKPIISTVLNDQRVIAVNRRLLWSQNWHTFHDFLNDYPRIALSDDWFLGEVRKPIEERHVIVTWFVRAREQATESRATGLQTAGTPATGALSAYMRFAYALYALHHSVAVEQLMLDRIKSARGFPGAMYEVRVAASLLRAGFTLELEDETDRRTTHVEFVATHTATGTRYSVEAKRREGQKLKLNKLLHSALTKRADHPRIVFVDTNDGRLDIHKFEHVPMPLAEARHLLNLYDMDPVSHALPSAYVIATWAPEEHHLDATGSPFATMLLGFRVDDLAPGYRTLLEQVHIRRRHRPVFDLIESMVKHRNVPATFDGQAMAFAKGEPPNSLRVGEPFEVAGPNGEAVEGLLESGVVMPGQKAAWCVFRGQDGSRFMNTVPLTDAELEAYRQHPSTFFGAIDRNAGRKQAVTAMDHFDFLWESYQKTDRDTLLDWMQAAPNIDELRSLEQTELATRYCVGMAWSMMRELAVRRAPAANADLDDHNGPVET
ncbi:MAG TPA: SEC-C domain-containing protein [Burkholderiaceae bacterium]|nr:SEC-C domain-containing protein [Burkholderiaceae bacterium]